MHLESSVKVESSTADSSTSSQSTGHSVVDRGVRDVESGIGSSVGYAPPNDGRNGPAAGSLVGAHKLWRSLPLSSYLHQQYFSMEGDLAATKVLLFCAISGFVLSALVGDHLHKGLSGNVESILVEAKILKLISSLFIYGRPLYTSVAVNNAVISQTDSTNDANSQKSSVVQLSDGSSDIPVAIVAIGIMALLAPLIERRSPHGEFIPSAGLRGGGGALASRRGAKHLIFMTVVVGIVSELSVLFIFLSNYYLTFDTYYLEKSVYGLPSLIGAYVVSLVEIMPDSKWTLYTPQSTAASAMTAASSKELSTANGYGLRIKYLPLALAFVCLLLMALDVYYSHMVCILSGVYVSWLYLRFFAYMPMSGRKGNSDDTFAFAALFPDVAFVQTPVSVAANAVYTLFAHAGCCTAPSTVPPATGGAQHRAGVLMMSPNSESLTDLDMESFEVHLKPEESRQRMEAKKMIESRLAKLQREMHSRALQSAPKK